MTPYPSQTDLFGAESVLPWIDEHFLRSDPYAFSGNESAFKSFVSTTSAALDVDPNGIFCIGSGAIGLSLNPEKATGNTLKSFDESSDLDIAIISNYHFEEAWRNLLRLSQPTSTNLDEKLKDRMRWQRKRLFDGAILTHILLPHLSFGADWILANNKIATHALRLTGVDRELHFWIYRDYWSLRNYVTDGFMKCKRKVAS